MKFEPESSNKNPKDPNEQNEKDMATLIQRLPVLNDYFQLHNKIGQGTFSHVYLATPRNSNSTRKYAVKHLIQHCKQSKVESELRCLQEIGGQDNVVPAELCLTNGNDCVTFIMPYLPHFRFADYVMDMDADETRLYMKNLFIALRRVHSFNIIHRDVKPKNFLYNRETKEFLLIDFGLAQSVKTPNENNVNAAIPENLSMDHVKKRKRSLESSEEEVKCSTSDATRTVLKSKDNNVKIWKPSLKVPLQPKADNQDKTAAQVHQNRVVEATKIRKSVKLSASQSVRKARVYNSPATVCRKVLESGDAHTSVLTFPGEPGSRTERKEKSSNENVGEVGGIAAEPPKPGHSRGSKMARMRVPCGSQHGSASSSHESPSTSFYLSQTCPCTGKGAVCSLCWSSDRMDASRAGTSGFRAPEVLFKYMYQTTAVDMWAAGVVMLSILSRCYPFFDSSSDLVSLAEIMTVFGTERTMKVATKFGRRIVCSEKKKGVDLKKLCSRLRARSANKSEINENYLDEPMCRDCQQAIRSDGCLCPSENGEETSGAGNAEGSDGKYEFPDSAYQLLYRLLDLDPTTRITAAEALEHPFITGS